MEAVMEFSARGYRKKPGFGLSYLSECKRYRIYYGDQVGYVKWSNHGLKPRWYAHRVDPDGRALETISRHRTKHRAIQACEKDARTR